jgi:hypothetical protein
MTNPETIDQNSKPASQESASSTSPTPPASKATNNRNVIIIGIGIVVLCLCACAGLCAITLGTSLIQGITQQDDIELTLDSFMSAMEDKDTQKAYSYFSTQAQNQIAISDLEKLLEGNNYVLFEDYQNVSIENISFSTGFSTFQNAPKGSVANLSAIVSYSGGFKGRLTAVLEQENGQWRLYNINVVVPPDKLLP